MPRGEETQDVPQEEGRDRSEEIRAQDLEGNQEAQRDAEVIAEPEAVVERERPVAESEAIEAAVVEAVEAAAEAPALSPNDVKEDGGRSADDVSLSPDDVKDDVGRGTEVQEAQAAEELVELDGKGSPKVEEDPPRPPQGTTTDGAEVSQSPDDVKDDGRPETGDRESTAVAATEAGGRRTENQDQVSATPITLPKEDPDGIKAGGNEVSATPITLPKEDPDGIKVGRDEVSATPITLPKEDSDGIKAGGDEISATPITLPKEDPDGIPHSARDSARQEELEGKLPEEEVRNQPGSSGGEVAATPINLPNVADNPDPIFNETQTDAAIRTAGQEPGDDVAATPINLPNVAREIEGDPHDPPPPPDRTSGMEDPDLRLPVEEVQNQPGSDGGNVAATPINLPNVMEEPGHGPNPITDTPEMDQSALDGTDPEMALAEEKLDEDRDEILDQTAFKVESPLSEGEILDEIDPDLPEGALETAEQDPDAPLDGSEQVPPEELKENEKAQDIKNAEELGLGWYIHEDGDGNQTVVDADGNPVKSPPVLIQYQGKTYATYPGDKPAIDEKGVIQDPTKLIELSGYETPVNEMFIHEHSDGSVTVVDKDGNPIPSQPSVITYQGKKYIGYPGQDLGIDETGKVTDPNALKSHEAKYFKQSTQGMFIHDDGQGNLTVVDDKGNPVSSQPAIISYEGKNYIVYPGQNLGLDASGKVTDINALKSHEASFYKAPADGMFLHDDGNGNLTAVDEAGKPVASQPVIITHEGKQYFVYPGQDAGIDDQGKITDLKKLKAHEANYYKQPTDGMSIHDDGQGNLTVVDRDGKPVDSQPSIVNYQGKQYLVYPGQETGVDNTGKVTDPNALKAHEASYYEKETENMFLHDDGKGNYTVVDGDGQPVDSPPMIVEKDGKIYATYPGWDDGIDQKGVVTDPEKLKSREISFYKPPWWQKKGIS